jgi:hypothetical protein
MAGLALTEAARNRLSKLLGILGSDHAGERDNAGVAANRLVRDAGLTWNQVLHRPRPMPDRVGESRKPAERAAKPARKAKRGKRSTGRDDMDRQDAKPQAGPQDPSPQTIAAFLVTKHRASMSAWEADFCGGLHRFPALSEKQRAVLKRIAERILRREVRV